MNSTLECMAALNVAAHLYNDPEVKEHLLDFKGSSKEWEKFISEKTMKLLLTVVCQKKVADIANSVGLKIRAKKIKFDRIHSYCSAEFLRSDIAWTPEELFVGKKAVEILALDRSIDIAFLFTLACDLCLEDKIISLWQQMPMAMKNRFLRDSLPDKATFWAYVLTITDDATYHSYYDDLLSSLRYALLQADFHCGGTLPLTFLRLISNPLLFPKFHLKRVRNL
ncbi:hypothetical protein AVEN_22977-1 [Araneus ventricosus]|uniref:Uncharacterized protein n=1 Tax=Araneus ventricosus TaxID=182803 RepID=A0A4Y2WS26_ARAVE|nr:hypothetical protein AVEN_22977-1 [Araneus ventricosus]